MISLCQLWSRKDAVVNCVRLLHLLGLLALTSPLQSGAARPHCAVRTICCQRSPNCKWYTLSETACREITALPRFRCIVSSPFWVFPFMHTRSGALKSKLLHSWAREGGLVRQRCQGRGVGVIGAQAQSLDRRSGRTGAGLRQEGQVGDVQ